MTRQLAEIAERLLPPAAGHGLLALLVTEAAERCARRGERLLLIVDGLDEDQGVKPSIAALLPLRPPENLRVLVMSRRHPSDPREQVIQARDPRGKIVISQHKIDNLHHHDHKMLGVSVLVVGLLGAVLVASAPVGPGPGHDAVPWSGDQVCQETLGLAQGEWDEAAARAFGAIAAVTAR